MGSYFFFFFFIILLRSDDNSNIFFSIKGSCSSAILLKFNIVSRISNELSSNAFVTRLLFQKLSIIIFIMCICSGVNPSTSKIEPERFNNIVSVVT